MGAGSATTRKTRGADPLGDRLDGAPLAGPVAPLEHDADLEPLVHHPLLQLHQFTVQPGQFGFIGLAGELLGRAVLGLAFAWLFLLPLFFLASKFKKLVFIFREKIFKHFWRNI